MNRKALFILHIAAVFLVIQLIGKIIRGFQHGAALQQFSQGYRLGYWLGGTVLPAALLILCAWALWQSRRKPTSIL